MALVLFIWTVGRREAEEGLGGDNASGRLEGFERGPGRKGLGEERDECRDLEKKRMRNPWLESRRERRVC